MADPGAKPALCAAVLACCLLALCGNRQQQASPRVLAFYSAGVERDHVMFAEQMVKFFAANAKAGGI